ncbi:MAG: response regulator [Cyanobacteria bacterium P01_A01_bin.17]
MTPAPPRLEKVLLIDDNEADNFIHRLIIEESGLVRTIEEFTDAQKALEYLRSSQANAIDLIFLDINMPRMNGFQFLEAYRDLAASCQSNYIAGPNGNLLRARTATRTNDQP